jgi:hypothetical protein
LDNYQGDHNVFKFGFNQLKQNQSFLQPSCPLFQVHPEDTLYQTFRLMKTQNIGSVVINENVKVNSSPSPIDQLTSDMPEMPSYTVKKTVGISFCYDILYLIKTKEFQFLDKPVYSFV